MITWISIPEEKVKHWIKGTGPDSRLNCFKLATTSGSFDGPWSYALFVLDLGHPDILTAYFAKIHAEALDGGFNPFDNASGIGLTQGEVYGLIELLEMQTTTMDEQSPVVKPSFQLMKEEEYKYFHVYPLSSAHNYIEEHYYRQVQPHGQINGNDISTILLFSKEKNFDGFYFQVMQFLTRELQNPDFHPRDHALPLIHLGKADILSLLTLFKRFTE